MAGLATLTLRWRLRDRRIHDHVVVISQLLLQLRPDLNPVLMRGVLANTAIFTDAQRHGFSVRQQVGRNTASPIAGDNDGTFRLLIHAVVIGQLGSSSVGPFRVHELVISFHLVEGR